MSIKLKDTIYDLINNSDKLDGKDSSAFSLTTHTHSNYSQLDHTHSQYLTELPSHSHNYASTVKIGSTSYNSSNNVISLPAYPTLSSLGASANSHNHDSTYLKLAGGTMTNVINFQTATQTALINARYDGTNYTNILWHKHGDSSGTGSTVIFGSPYWENVILETKANQNCAYRQTSGTKYKIWDSGNDGSDSGLDADLLDGVHLMGKGGTRGIMRSWARGTYTTTKQYFGNGNVVVIDPKPTDDTSLWANTTIFSVGDMEIRSHQLAFGYAVDKILYRRIDDGPRYNSWRTLAFTDSKVSNASYADNSGQLGGYGTGTFYMAGRGSLNKDTLGTFTQRASGGYLINGYSGYSGLLISLQGNSGSCSSIEFIAPHYDISVGGLQVRYTIDSSWYGTTKSIAFLDSNVASASKLATARTISLTGSVTGSGSFDGSGNLSISTTTNHSHSYLPLSGGTMTGNITVFTGDNGRGLKFGTSTLNSLSNQLLWQSPEAIRFGSASWDWNAWAGLKYNHSSKIIYLGLADGTIFNANSAQSGGKLYTPGISSIYVGNGSNIVLHSGNWSSYCAAASHTHSYLSTNIAGSLTSTATVNYANTPYGINYRNHYTGHGLGSYRGVLSCKDNSVGFELNSYWCVNPADGVGTNNLYYRVKRDAASDWGPYARIIDSGNIGSQSVNYANSAGNSNTVDGYHISVGTSAGSDTSTIYFIT